MYFSEEIANLVLKLKEAGKTYTQLVLLLAVEYGYALPVAHRIVEAVTQLNGNDYQLFNVPTKDQDSFPDIDTRSEQTMISLKDKTVNIAFEQLSPRMVLIHDFLFEEECDSLCEQAQAQLSASQILEKVRVTETHTRSSQTAYFVEPYSPLISTIENRIQELIKWPATHSEKLQVQRYQAQGRYQPHYDFFHANGAEYEEIMQNGGQRLATLIIYLQQPEAGGGTYFANLGMRIMPRKGSAIFFNYPEPKARSGTLHAGDTVISGEKWIMTKWFREKPFKFDT